MLRKTYQQNVIIKTEDRDALARMVLDEISASLSALADLHDKVGDWNRRYEGIPEAKDEPWDNCSNLWVPITQWQVDVIAANVARTVFGTEPVIRVEPHAGKGKLEAANELESWLRYLMDRVGLRKTKGKELSLAATKHGTAIAKLTQDKWTDTVRDVRWGPEGITSVIEKSQDRTAPRLDYVPLRDFVMCPAESLTIRSAVGVGDRKRLRLAEIKALERVGLYEKGTAEKVAEQGPAGTVKATETQEEIGVEPGRHTAPSLDTYERWEMIWALPLKQTDDGWEYDSEAGEERDVLLTIIGDRPVLARCILYPWFHNRRHYIPFRILPREAEFWGRSIPQILEHLQDEINTEHNQRNDLRSILLSPTLIAVKGTGIEDSAGKRQIVMGPGKVVWVDENPANLQWMKPPQQSFDSVAEENLLVDYGERATGVTEARLGKREPGEQTLGEVQITESQGGIRFDDMVDGFQGGGDFREGEGLCELAYQLIGLSVQFADPEAVYRVLGDEGDWLELRRPRMTMEDAIGGYDYVPVGNTITSNRTIQQNQTLLLHRELIQHPLVANNPINLWNLAKRLLDVFDIKEWQAIIGTEEDARKQWEMMQQQMAMAGGAAGPEGMPTGAPAGVPEAEWQPEEEFV